MTVSLGMIGIGGLGHLQAKACAELEDVAIVAGADIAQEARDVFRDEFQRPVYSDYHQLLRNHGDDLDAVTIVTPHTLHYEQAKTCLEHGVHVLVEKPMVTDVDHARELVDIATDRGLVLQVGYQRHFHPVFQTMRRHVVAGRIGQLHTVNCFIGQDWVRAQSGTWRLDPQLSGGGQLYDTGSHLLDALLWITDCEPVSVTAQIEFAEPNVDVNSTITLECRRDGQPFVASIAISGDGLDVSPEEGYVLYGTAGRLSCSDGVIELSKRDGTTYRTEIDGGSDFQTLTRQKIGNFVDSVAGRADPAVPGRVGYRVTAVTEAIYRAAERGEKVAIQPFEREPEQTD